MPLKKLISLIAVFLLCAPLAFPKIDITTNQNSYNIGSSIIAYASVIRDDSFDGFLKLSIVCSTSSLQFYLSPITLEKNFRTSTEIPPFKASEWMLGNCLIEGSLLYGDTIAEYSKSGTIKVSNELNIQPSNILIKTSPGDEIKLIGKITDSNGDTPLSVVVSANFDGKYYNAQTADNGEYLIVLRVPPQIKSGMHNITVSAADKNKNAGDAIIAIDVTPIPTSLEAVLSNTKPWPGEKITILPTLLDQHGDKLNATVSIDIRSPSNKKIFSKKVESNAEFYYEVRQYDAPGTYSLELAYNNLLDTGSFIVPEKHDVTVNTINNTVIFENIGNTVYEDTVTLQLVGKKQYTVKKHITLNPGESVTIDPSTEAEAGVYEILLGNPEDSNSTLHLENSAESVVAESLNVTEDNRPAYKKIGSGLKGMTASVIGADGLLTKNRLAAPLVLISVVLGTVFLFAKNKIFKLFRGGH